MQRKSFDDDMDQLERALYRASKAHHRCVGATIEKFLQREVGFNDVSDHCTNEKKKVDGIMKELKGYHA